MALEALDDTEMVYEFKTDTHIYFYAGEEKPVASEEPGKVGIRSNATGIIEKGPKEIKFFPYIRMTFMDNTLDLAKKEEQNTKRSGHRQNTRESTYVLSEHESSILPYDAAELYWYHPNGNDDTIKLTSQQWSTHKKATSGSDGWQGPNQVLPGGAIYQLSTDQNNPAKVVFTTYNTIVDEKARKEYLTSETTIGENDYTTEGITEDLLDFINQAKSSLGG